MRKIDHIQIHHSQTSMSDFDGDNHEKIWSGFKRFHISKGWGDIAYHFGVFPDGKILDGRPLSRDPAGIAFHNRGGIALCLIGNFDVEQPTVEALTAIVELIRRLLSSYDLDTNSIVFHREFTKKKNCPGKLIDKAEFINMIEGA